MECNYFSGQKLVCINAGIHPLSGRIAKELTEGSVYTVKSLRVWRNIAVGVILFEVAADSPMGFNCERFRPATDISSLQETVRRVFDERREKAKIRAGNPEMPVVGFCR